jgi:hypothetical protein
MKSYPMQMDLSDEQLEAVAGGDATPTIVVNAPVTTQVGVATDVTTITQVAVTTLSKLQNSTISLVANANTGANALNNIGK